MSRTILSTDQKALAINLDGPPYGTIAEIGAGQEVAAHFFHVGAASGTIAKSMSAYDMTMSDAIYGPTPTRQYVSRERMVSMLEHEYNILVERLDDRWGDRAQFFAFSNTVRAKAYGDTNQECHGWMGIRFQTQPRGPSHDVLIHVRLFDDELTEQQEALGVLGVNLIYAAFYHRGDLKEFVESLADNLKLKRFEIDFLKITGPEFADLDNRLCALRLVESGLTPSAFFTAKGEVMQASEYFYRKPLVLLRGRFDPVTRVHLDMLSSASREIRSAIGPGDPSKVYVEIMELTMHNLLESAASGAVSVDHQKFLQRADVLQSLGKNVLVSKFAEFHRLGAFLSRYTREPVGIVLGATLLEELFQEKWYETLDGGILESFGRLFKHSLRLYVYPEHHRPTGRLRSAADIEVAPHLRNLFEHLMENAYIVPLIACDDPALRYSTADIRAMIEAGNPEWRQLVPPEVVGAMEAGVAGH